MNKGKNVDTGYRQLGGGGCNGVTQTVGITGMVSCDRYKKRSVKVIGVLLFHTQPVIPHPIDYG